MSTSPYRQLPVHPRPVSPSSPTPAHVHPHVEEHMDHMQSKVNKRGFSLKKDGDPMTFDLRDPKNGRVRELSNDECESVFSHFPDCVAYTICAPFIILECTTPPVSAPITIGGLPAMFVDNNQEDPVHIGELGNPKIPDFGSSEFIVCDNVFPSFQTVEKAFKLFDERMANVTAVSYQLDSWLVEITTEHELISLPGKFGRRPVRYKFSSKSSPQSRERLQSLTNAESDNSNYRHLGLSPGVKLCGLSMSSTSGVLVQHADGRKRLTVANHSFYDTNSVYHPDRLPNFYLGEIRERYFQADIGLCEFARDVNYSNSTYFTANPPKKLVTTSYAATHCNQASWFEAEGITTGQVQMLYMGPRVTRRNIPEELRGAHRLSLTPQYLLKYFGKNDTETRAGICGAPVVHEPNEDPVLDGIVIGFFFILDGTTCIVPNLNRFVSEQWELAL